MQSIDINLPSKTVPAILHNSEGQGFFFHFTSSQCGTGTPSPGYNRSLGFVFLSRKIGGEPSTYFDYLPAIP
jgi:hypothetical protein